MIVDRITGQPVSAYTPPEDCIVVNQPRTARCRKCGATLADVGLDIYGDVIWESTSDGAVTCTSTIFAAEWHEPFGVDWR